MTATKTAEGRASSKRDLPPTMCAPLAHPLRVRILEVTNERDISPSVFVDEGLQPDGISFPSRAHGLSHVSYHFRELEKAGCIEVVQTQQRRGATEHIYRGCARVEFTTEEFNRLPKEQRRMFSRNGMQAIVAKVDGAMSADTFDSRTDRFLVNMGLELDEQGWEAFIAALDNCYDQVKRINDEAGSRLVASEQVGIPAHYAMLGFESPSPPMPRWARRSRSEP